MRDLPEWLEDFTEHFVDEEASASSGQAQYFRTLPEAPTLRSLQEDQNYKGPLQKTHWKSSTSSSKGSIISVQNKNFSGNRTEFTKVPRADIQAASHSHTQFIGVWQGL